MSFERFDTKVTAATRDVPRVSFYNSGLGCLSAALVRKLRDDDHSIELFYDRETNQIGMKPVRGKRKGGILRLTQQKKGSVLTFSGRGFLSRWGLSFPCGAVMTWDADEAMFTGTLEKI